MDWSSAIEMNREALKRVLAMLVAMAGLDERPATLPRHLHRAVLSLLRPAESAARRLIIAVARGIVVTMPSARPRQPGEKSGQKSTILRDGIGTGIVLSPGFRPGASRRPPRSLALPLFDPLPRWGVPSRPALVGVPRISVPGLSRLHPVPPPPSRDDPIDAKRLCLRVAALGRALDDLPGQARRFARWRAARQARSTIEPQDGSGAGRFRRVWPLRPGRPPGGRLWRYDPDAPRRSRIREVDEILSHAHALACHALSPDTS